MLYLIHPFQQMRPNPQGIRHDRQRRIYGGARWKEAAVNDVEIVDVVRFAMNIECGFVRIGAETDRAVLVGHSSKRNSVA